MLYCDVKTCVGCRMCEVACSLYHFGAVSPALARIRVAKLEDVGLDMAVACVSCLEKPCLECPDDALTTGPQGTILLDAGLCNGCGVCVAACPIGAAGFHLDQPLFCDLCDGATSCVNACPIGALVYVEEFRDIPLPPCAAADGSPGLKRARFAAAQGEPLRESWKRGARVDS